MKYHIYILKSNKKPLLFVKPLLRGYKNDGLSRLSNVILSKMWALGPLDEYWVKANRIRKECVSTVMSKNCFTALM